MNENIVKLEKWIKESDNIVFFGGAGVSTESGIPDSEVLTDFITKSMIILLRQFYHTVFL